MKRTWLTEEVLKMKFDDVYHRYKSRSLTCEEASDLMGVSVSSFFRKRKRYESEFFDGRFDRRLGHVSPHKAADKEVERITRLYHEKYLGFSVQHFYEFAEREHQVNRSYNWVRTTLQKNGVIQKSTRGGKHRLRRERKAMRGMMIHQDGSTHQWVPALDYQFDLIVTMDDATSEITTAFFVEEEGTISTLKGLYETINKYGLFCSLYTDRGSHYFYTDQAGGKVDKSKLTQVGRALQELGIRHIAAYSPEARGRSERLFGTLQNRLPKEFVLHHIQTFEEANRYLQEVYIPRHNKQFTVKSKSEETAYVPWNKTQQLDDYLCIKEDRIVQHDNTVHYKKLILQIPKNKFRHQYIKARVTVHEYMNGSMAIFYGPLKIGKYDSKGRLSDLNQTVNF